MLAVSDAGATLLEGSHVTLVGCRIDILKAIIGAGAQVNLALQHRRPNLQANVTPTSNAAADGHTEAKRALIFTELCTGADPSGFTTIYFATESEHAEAITALIQCEADPSIADTDKRTPFFTIRRVSGKNRRAKNKHSDVLEALLVRTAFI